MCSRPSPRPMSSPRRSTPRSATVVVVSKRRRLFLWEGVRIHLDEVEDLGNFVEFEAVLPQAGDLATAHEGWRGCGRSSESRTRRWSRSGTRIC